MDSTYNIWGDQVKVLNYQLALQSFLVSEFTQSVNVEVEKIDNPVKSVSEAIEVARKAQADFAVIGTIAELPTAIRGDAQLVDVALGQVPRGYQASSTAVRWEDLSAVADDLANQLLSFILRFINHPQRIPSAVWSSKETASLSDMIQHPTASGHRGQFARAENHTRRRHQNEALLRPRSFTCRRHTEHSNLLRRRCHLRRAVYHVRSARLLRPPRNSKPKSEQSLSP